MGALRIASVLGLRLIGAGGGSVCLIGCTTVLRKTAVVLMAFGAGGITTVGVGAGGVSAAVPAVVVVDAVIPAVEFPAFGAGLSVVSSE